MVSRVPGCEWAVKQHGHKNSLDFLYVANWAGGAGDKASPTSLPFSLMTALRSQCHCSSHISSLLPDLERKNDNKNMFFFSHIMVQDFSVFFWRSVA